MKYCTSCGKKLEENSGFCVECGTKVDDGVVKPNKKVSGYSIINVILGIISFIAAMTLFFIVVIPSIDNINKYVKPIDIMFYVLLSILPLIISISGIILGIDLKNEKGGKFSLVLNIISTLILVTGFILLEIS